MRRQGTLGTLAVVAAVTGSLAGCGRAPSCGPAGCGTVVVVSAAEADGLFPPTAASDVSVGLVDLLFSKLADVDSSLNTMGDSGFVPVLARQWRWEDSLTLVFTLRPEARWHDGARVTAGDVAYTFAVYRDTAVASVASSRLDAIETVMARDSGTAVFRFRHPYPEAFFDAVYHMRILPRHLLDSVPPARLPAHPFGRNPVGSGPYRFVRWNPGELVELAADSGYFQGRPGIARVIWRFTGDPFAAVTELIAGSADVMGAVGGADDVRRLAGSPDLRTIAYPLAVYGYVGFNFRDPDHQGLPHPLFADRALRRALTMAVDRAALVRAALGAQGRVPAGPVGSASWLSREPSGAIPFDSAGARRALAELGWRDTDGDGVLDQGGVPLAFHLLVPTSSGLRRRAATLLQEQLRRAGVAVTIDELEFNVFMSRAAAGRFDAYLGMWAQDPSPASIAETWTSAGIGDANFGAYASPAFDSMVQRALGGRDPQVVRDTWRAALAQIDGDAPAIWLLAPTAVAAVDRRIRNVSIRPDQWTSTLWMWKVR